MAERIPKHPEDLKASGWRLLNMHPLVQLYRGDNSLDGGGGVSEFEKPPIAIAQFFGEEILFDDTRAGGDRLQVWIAEKVGFENQINGVELVIGTRNHGDRLTLSYSMKRENFEDERSQITGYPTFLKLDYRDEKILILSRDGSATHILDNLGPRPNRDSNEQLGYMLMGTATIQLTPDGIILLIPNPSI